MDLFVSLLYWPFKTFLWIFPLIIVIYCAYKEGYKKASILLLSMICSSSFVWLHQWNFWLFLQQASVFLIAAVIIVFDLVYQNKRSQQHSEDKKTESKDDYFTE